MKYSRLISAVACGFVLSAASVASASTYNPATLTTAQVGTIDGEWTIGVGGSARPIVGYFTADDSQAQGTTGSTYKADDWLIHVTGAGTTTATELTFTNRGLFSPTVRESNIFGLGLYELKDGQYSLINEAVKTGGLGVVFSLSAYLDHAATYLLHITGTNSAVDGYIGSVSAVPLPAAVWLFGSALLGFVTLSNRRKV